MAPITINDLTDIGVAIASADFVPVWDVSGAASRKVSRADFMGGVLTGGGTVATAGHTLTVPDTGTAVLRNIANTFSAAQTFQGTITQSGTGVSLDATGGDNGAGGGRYITLGRNNNGSTPASGHIRIARLSGTVHFIWPDNSGNLRIHNAEPTNAADTAGTVVGAQTSSLDAKHLLGGESGIDDVLAAVRAGSEAVRRFIYRDGSFGGEEFEGVVVDYAPRYGMDRDAEHPAGKSLNLVTVVGDLLRAVAYLADRVAALEGKGHGD